MKKLLVLFFVTVLAVFASAQEYKMGAGINLGLATSGSTHVGIGAKYQYNLSDTIRIEADLEYWAKSSNISIFDFSVNAHYLINASNDFKFKLYPIVGLGLARVNWSYKSTYYDGGDDDFRDEDYEGYEGDWGWGVKRRKTASRASSTETVKYSSSATRLLLNLGAGVQYELTPVISVNFEIVGQLMKDYSRKHFLIGATYNF